jgi:hypothetical protein
MVKEIMKTASYVLEEKQIEFVENEAKARAEATHQASASSSAVMRHILSSMMETQIPGKRIVAYKGSDGILHLDPDFAKTGDGPVSQEQVSTNQQ